MMTFDFRLPGGHCETFETSNGYWAAQEHARSLWASVGGPVRYWYRGERNIMFEVDGRFTAVHDVNQ